MQVATAGVDGQLQSATCDMLIKFYAKFYFQVKK